MFNFLEEKKFSTVYSEGKTFTHRSSLITPNEHPEKNPLKEVSDWLVKQGYDSLFERCVESIEEKAERYKIRYEKSNPEVPLKDLLKRINTMESVNRFNLGEKVLMAMMFDMVMLDEDHIMKWLATYT